MLGIAMTMPPDEAAVEMTPGVDPHQFTLTPQEVFMMTRALLGRQSVRELLERSGLPEAQGRELLQSLVQKGVLQVEGLPAKAPVDRPTAARPTPAPTVPPVPSQVASAPNVPLPVEVPQDSQPPRPAAQSATAATRATAEAGDEDIPYNQAELDEPCDLTLAQKKRILRAEWLFENRSYHAVFGVRLEAESAAIKKSYFKVSRDFHPDAYFRKELGGFKGKVERIFRELKEAYATLSDAERRAAYERKLSPTQLDEADRPILEKRLAKEMKALAEAERTRERDARVAESLKKKRLAANPMLQRVKKAREWVLAAENAAAAGNASEAVRLAHLAREYAPKDEKVSLRARKIIQVQQLRAARELIQQAQKEAEEGKLAESLETADQALKLSPQNALLNHEACQLFKKAGENKRAMGMAQIAAEHSPYEADYWLLYAELAEGEAEWPLALKAAERLLELRPNARDSNVRLKRVRKAAEKAAR